MKKIHSISFDRIYVYSDFSFKEKKIVENSYFLLTFPFLTMGLY